MDYIKLINQIKDELPNKAIDIMESLELLKLVLSETVEEIGERINIYFSQKQYDKIPYYSTIANDIEAWNVKIEEIFSAIDIDNTEVEEEAEEEQEVKTIPNYDEYRVDTNVEHTLYESFTHKRPFGFKLREQPIVEVRTWQDMLVKTCEYLMEIDKKKFLSFENITSMNGKKNKYFSKTPKDMRKPKKIADEIYVETNQSGNAIRNLIIKLLREYHFSINEYKVYFRADYTNLNS